MARPLKIAKAQAVLTITATSASTQLVTVSETLSQPSDGFTSSSGEGILAGMPFVVATTTGGLTAGVTYYINEVIGANTFSVSTTQLSVQPRVLATLSDAGPVTVKATVGIVDYGFNNPNNSNTSNPSGSNQSFGVVGGNTAIYGKQTLCNVAFGQSGTGTVFASTGSPIVVGLGTDFANVATGSHIYAVWGAGAGPTQLLGTATSTKGNLLVGLANTNATGNLINVDPGSNAQSLTAGTPVVFDVSAGGLVAGTTYFVKTIANAVSFTVSNTPGGAVRAVTTNASVTGNAIQNRVVLSANSANNASGVDGYGDPFVTALPEAGYIVRQKGKTKYLVQGTVTGILAQAYTANVANTALTPNTMSIIATNAASGTQYVSSLNDYQSELFPDQVDAGNLVPGTVYTIYSSGDTDWTAVGAMGNMTGITFTATDSGSGTGYAIASNANPDVIASFNSAAAANAYYTPSIPVVTINNA